MYLEAEPTGPPDRLHTKGEGERRIAVCSLSGGVGCGGKPRLGKLT